MSDGLVQLPSGRWRWRVAVNGVRMTGTEDTEPLARLARAKAAVEGGKLLEGDATMTELLDMWLAEVNHAPSTARVRDDALKAVPSAFMGLPARDVTPAIIAGLWRQLASKGVSGHTVRKIRNALSRAFEHGIAYGVVYSNPTRVARPKAPPTQKRHDPPTPEQVNALIKAAPTPALRMWIRLAATIGARPGEVCGIQWSDVDLERGKLSIVRGISKHRDITAGKKGTKGHRTIDLDDATVAAMRQYRRDAMVGSPWLFSDDGRTAWNPDRTARRVADLADELKFDHWWLYDLRHYVATQMLADGVDVVEVAKVLGNSPATVMKYYAHAIPGNTAVALAGMSAKLDA